LQRSLSLVERGP